MVAVVLLLISLPVVAAIIGYVKFGLLGAVLGGVGAFVGVGVLIALPFSLLVQNERRKAEKERVELDQWTAKQAEARNADQP